MNPFASLLTRLPDRNLWVVYRTMVVLSTAYGIALAVMPMVLEHRGLPPDVVGQVESALRAHPAVLSVHDLKTRSAGLTKFIQLHVELDPALPLLRAHEIGDRVEADLQRAYPEQCSAAGQ